MKQEFRLADIGEGLEEAEIIEWRVQLGDEVKRDQPLLEVMTDKSNAELPAPFAGTIVQIGGEVGDMIRVGELIAVIDDAAGNGRTDHEDEHTTTEASPGEVRDQHTAPEVAHAEAEDAASTIEQISPDEPGSAVVARPKASPTTRREAARRGIDLSAVAGSGPAGRILLSDLDGALVEVPGASPIGTTPPPQPRTARPAEGVESQTLPLRGVRRKIAQNMAQSWTHIPHIHAFDHIDAQPLVEMRDRLKGTDRPEFSNLTPLTFFVAAVASALRAYPQVNSSIDMANETITQHGSVNIGVAVAAPQGLVVPVVHNADSMSFGELCQQMHTLIAAARAGTLSRESFMAGTATITNFGSLGGEQATPLIRPPESIIVGFGAVADRPFVVDGQVVARKTMNVVMGADHRLLDGDVTTAFLAHVTDRLTEPLMLVLGG